MAVDDFTAPVYIDETVNKHMEEMIMNKKNNSNGVACGSAVENGDSDMNKESKNNGNGVVVNKTTVKGGSSMKNGKFYYSNSTDREIYLVNTTDKINNIWRAVIKHDVVKEVNRNIVNFQEDKSCGIKFKFINNKVMVSLITIKELMDLESTGEITDSLLRFSDSKEFRIRDRLEFIKSIIQENKKDDNDEDSIEIYCPKCGYRFAYNFVEQKKVICPNCGHRYETMEFAISVAMEDL